jgi:hypothetical protein
MHFPGRIHNVEGSFAPCWNECGAGFAVSHPGSLKDVKSVLPLVKKKSSRVRRNGDPKEVM